MKARLAVPLMVLLAACSSGSGHDGSEPSAETVTRSSTTTTSATAAPAPAPALDLDAIAVHLTRVNGADQPIAMTWCEGHRQPLVAEQRGKIHELTGAAVLDLTSQVRSGGEQGLLGLACRGDRIYVNYTNRSGDTRVDEIAPGGGRRTLVAVDQPAPNHNGGNIVFGPDGKLWVGFGDGGGANDQFDNGQQPGEILGSMTRLDPADPKPEIVVKGVRNPWRWSFDRQTGDLWIGDVGQGDIEEIDRLPAGFGAANLGWPAFEGTSRLRKDVAAPPGAVAPVYEYHHDKGQAVVGGYVYRGRAIPALVGAYLFTDTYTSRLQVLDPLTHRVRDLGPIPGGTVSSFAEAPDGELYVLSLGGNILRIDPA
jgi:glucose/arabinose dehydrogenase